MLPVRIDGIDVYQYDNIPSWQVVADQGPWFVIVKIADDGNTDRDAAGNPINPVRHEDGAFRKLWTSARDAGLIRGFYHFFRPTKNGTRESVEAKCQELIGFVEDAGGVSPGDLPPAIDVENRGAADLSAAGTTDILNQIAWWLDIMENWWASRTGHRVRPIIYTGNFWREGIVAPQVPDPTPTDPHHTKDDPKFRPGLDNPLGPHTTPAPESLQVDFSNYPLWVAGYPADPEGNCTGPNGADPDRDALLRQLSLPNPWLDATWAIWQYSKCGQVEGQPATAFLDVNVIASIVQQTNAHGLRARLVKSTDTTPLLKLAAVASATGTLDLHRVDALSHRAPDQVFSLLLLGQGFWPDEFEGIVDEALNGLMLASPWGGVARVDALTDIAPFNLLRSRPWSDRVACYYHACTDGDSGLLLRLRQKQKSDSAEPDRLSRASSATIGAQLQPQLDSLSTFLGKLQVTLSDGTKQPATNFWPVGERCTGLRGKLIVVLRKAEKSWERIPQGQLVPASHDERTAELYTIDPTTDDPVPFVAVNVVPGQNWPALMARAIAQNLGALADEYELEGPEHDKPPALEIPPDPPNLITITDDVRKQLLGDVAVPPAKPQDAVVATRSIWLLPKDPAADFVSHDDPGGGYRPPNFFVAWNPANQPYALGGLHVVEGGDGYRHDVLRSDMDCLMRRMPAEIADTQPTQPKLPIQSDVPFCSVCKKRLSNALNGGVDLKIKPRVLLGSQRIEYDRIAWLAPQNDHARARTVLSAPASADKPSWNCTIDFDPTLGFRFTELELHHPAFWDTAAATDVAHVLKSIAFTELSVTFAVGTGTQQTVPLSIAGALAAGRPRHPKASPPRLDLADQGDTKGEHQLGARLSLCWEIADTSGKTLFLVDAVISLVLRGPANDADPSGAVTACRLYPQLSMRYRVPATGVSVKGFHGKIVFVADNADPSNLTGTLKGIAGGKLAVSLFTESNASPTDTVLAIDMGRPALTPASGRKLATLLGTLTNGTRVLLPLPDWSWRYDYVQPLLSATKHFLAVHDASEAAFANERSQAKVWPPGQTKFRSTIRKLARQGAYDGLYIHPDLGSDGTHPIVGAPWCGDLGLHLFWRRGLSVVASSSTQYDFAGWGAGRVDQGRETVRGAPVVPPNQRIDVDVTPSSGGATVQVTYETTTSAARADRWEVFLEQGLAYALRYAVDDPAGGLTSRQLSWLAAAIGVANEATIKQQLDAARGDPVTFDAAVRALVRKIFSHARWFDAGNDADSGEQVPTGDAILEAL